MASEIVRQSHSQEQRFAPERKAAVWALAGAVGGGVIGGVPLALLGAFGLGFISWHQARFGNRK